MLAPKLTFARQGYVPCDLVHESCIAECFRAEFARARVCLGGFGRLFCDWRSLLRGTCARIQAFDRVWHVDWQCARVFVH